MSRVPLDRVCIVMMSAVGDVVHVLPVLTSLKRANPKMHVTWILQPGPATLVRGHPLVDEIILFDRSAGLNGFLDIRRGEWDDIDLHVRILPVADKIPRSAGLSAHTIPKCERPDFEIEPARSQSRAAIHDAVDTHARHSAHRPLRHRV